MMTARLGYAILGSTHFHEREDKKEMEDLGMFEPEVEGLEDLAALLESLFGDSQVFVRLWLREERVETVHEHLLAQFAGTLDLCGIVQSEAEEDVALELLFREVDGADGGEEPRLMTMPVDSQDVEVDLDPDQVAVSSGSFTMAIERLG